MITQWLSSLIVFNIDFIYIFEYMSHCIHRVSFASAFVIQYREEKKTIHNWASNSCHRGSWNQNQVKYETNIKKKKTNTMKMSHYVWLFLDNLEMKSQLSQRTTLHTKYYHEKAVSRTFFIEYTLPSYGRFSISSL